MTPQELTESCVELFGEGWQTKLALSLKRPGGGNVNPRTVRRWAAGDTPIPAAVADMIEAKIKLKRISNIT